MQIKVLDAVGLRRALPRLIDKHDEIHIAVAWAHAGPVAKKLIDNRTKFRSVTIGVDFCATDPDFIDDLRDVPNAFVFKRSGSCFHPKIYVFRSGENVDAIIGSSNFTAGGLGSNVETCIHLTGSAGDDAIASIFATLRSFEGSRQPISPTLAAAYRRQAEIAAKRPRPRSPILPNDDKDFGRFESDLLKMPWSDFIEVARKDPNHHFDTRMTLLRYLATLFSREQSFAGLGVSEWKAVAGIVHDDAVGASGLQPYQIGWFGSMQGSGSFTNLVVNRDSRIARAIDCIPARDPVREADYEKFCGLFRAAFKGSARVGGVPTASRLLAMKRPDVFVCVNSGNREGLAKALSFAPTTLSLDNYWGRVIVPIQLSEWYNADRPTGDDAEAWDCRAALVDAIYYEVG